MKYKCPNNPEHSKFTASECTRRLLSGSPHFARLDCDECEEAMDSSFVTWLSKKEYDKMTQGVPEGDPTCPECKAGVRLNTIYELLGSITLKGRYYTCDSCERCYHITLGLCGAEICSNCYRVLRKCECHDHR